MRSHAACDEANSGLYSPRLMRFGCGSARLSRAGPRSDASSRAREVGNVSKFGVCCLRLLAVRFRCMAENYLRDELLSASGACVLIQLCGGAVLSYKRLSGHLRQCFRMVGFSFGNTSMLQ